MRRSKKLDHPATKLSYGDEVTRQNTLCTAPAARSRPVDGPDPAGRRGPCQPSQSPGAMSGHAKARCQQRGIPPGVVQLLYTYGAEVHDKHGGVILYFDKSARRHMARDLGRQFVRRLEPLLDAYVIEMEGRVITAGHRYARVTRH